MSQQPELGRRLKALRSSRGLRQADLAGDKVTVAYVSMVEAGKRTPGLEVLTHLASRLGCTVSELQGGPTSDEQAGWRLAVDYAEMALHNGEPAEALTRAGDVVAALAGATADVADPDLLWRARWARARAEESTGDLEGAARDFSELHADTASAVADLADPVRAMQVAVAWSRCLTQLGEVTRAYEVVEAASAAAGASGLRDTDGYAELAAKRMSLLYMFNDIDGAARVAEELIDLVEAGGTRRAKAAAYWNAAGVAEAKGDLQRALVMSERAVALLAEEDDERMLARARTACAWFMLRADPQRAQEALELLTKAREVLEVTGSVTDLAYARVEAGQALVLLDRPGEALAEAEAAVSAIGDEIQAESASAWLVRATALAALGQDDQARVSAARAEACLRELPTTRWTALGFRELGQVHELLGDATLALAAYRAALDVSTATPSPGASRSVGHPRSERSSDR